MKTYLHILLAALTLGLTSCLDEHGAPDLTDFPETKMFAASVSGEEYTIQQLKEEFGPGYMNSSNQMTCIDRDIVVSGVVVANDGINGNLYQTVVLRQILPDGTDQSIQLGIRNTCLYPYFPLGQEVCVNLKGLWVGNYSKVPKIGQPYYTSSGNRRLGPLLFNMLGTNFALVGKPNPEAPELQPIQVDEAWLKNTAQKYVNAPVLATVEGYFSAVQGANKDKQESGTVEEFAGQKEPLPKIIAPEVLRDAGYGVDREIKVGNQKLTLRTSTENDISFLQIPEGKVRLTGIMTYYSGWQIQLRDIHDFEILE